MRRALLTLWLATVAVMAAAGGPRAGGSLTIVQRVAPRTLNPILALDRPSREIIERTTADLLHVNRATDEAEPVLARRWTVSPDGRTFTFYLRTDARFSDGHDFDADDVVFSFGVYLDEAVNSPLRAALLLDGQPMQVQRIDRDVVRVVFPKVRAAAERVFDSVPILPRHLLEEAYRNRRLDRTWALDTPPAEMAGLGPFRVKSVAAGQRVVLERNPFYWKRNASGQPLPYLDSMVFAVTAGEDAQLARFAAGEADLVSRLSTSGYAALDRGPHPGYTVRNAGASLEYELLLLNTNRLDPESTGPASPELAAKQQWFGDVRFRQAVSMAIDRPAIARLAFGGLATPVWTHVSPANARWFNAKVPQPRRSTEAAGRLLVSAGFRLNDAHRLVDSTGHPVRVSLLVQTGNSERMATAVLVQADLAEIGIDVQIATLEFRALLDRVLRTRDYEACLLALGSGDVDPIAEMNVWTTGGSTHLWNLAPGRPPADWEREIDSLMEQQAVALDPATRKAMYDRVQTLVAEKLPMIPLVAPDVLTAVRTGLGNFKPVATEHQTLWNADELFWLEPKGRTIR